MEHRGSFYDPAILNPFFMTDSALTVSQGLAKLKDFDLSALTPEQTAVIKATVAPEATDVELSWFLYQCSSMGLNPLLKEVWFIKMSGKLIIMASYGGLYRKACENALFAGIQSMEVRANDEFEMGIDEGGQLKVMKHKFTGADRGEIVGAWARVTYSNGQTAWNYATFSEYKKEPMQGKTNSWKTNPTAMIKVRAESPLLKQSGKLSNIYTPEELPEEEGSFVEGEGPTAREVSLDELMEKITSIDSLEKYKDLVLQIGKTASGFLEFEQDQIRAALKAKQAELAGTENKPEIIPPNAPQDGSVNTSTDQQPDSSGSVAGA